MTNFSELQNHHLEFSGEKMITCERKRQSQDWMSSALLFTGRKSCPHRWNLTCSLFPLYGLLSVWQPDPCLLPLKKYGQIIDGHERPLFLSLNLFSVCECVFETPTLMFPLSLPVFPLSQCVSAKWKRPVSQIKHAHTPVFPAELDFLQKPVQPLFNWS